MAITETLGLIPESGQFLLEEGDDVLSSILFENSGDIGWAGPQSKK